MPSLSDIKKMSAEQLRQLAKELKHTKPGENFQDTATRLYMSGDDETAYLFQTMFFRLEEIKAGS